MLSPLRVPARPLRRRLVVDVLVCQELLGDGADEGVLCCCILGEGAHEKSEGGGERVRLEGDGMEWRNEPRAPPRSLTPHNIHARGLGSVSREQTESKTFETVRAGDHCSLRTSCEMK